MVKLQVKGGAANPSPPVGPALGSAGVNIMEFCKQFNGRTQDKPGQVLPVVITVYEDKSFEFVIKTPPAAIQLMDAAKIKGGSGEPNRNKVGSVSWDQVKKIDELMAAVDNWIELPVRDQDKPFLMPIEDVFSITGRGTVATGRIEAGVINTGDPVDIVGMGDEKLTSTITGVEMFRKILDRGEAGDNVGLLLRGIEKTDIKRGMVIAKKDSVKPHKKFKAEVYILSKEEGGRHTPFHNKYRPQFYVRTTDVTGEIFLPEGVEMVMPGDNLTITV